MLRSVHESQIIEKQIQQLFVEVISVWRDTDIKKNEAVRRLAARLEEYFIQTGQAEEIDTICRRISAKLEAAGLKTAHHVSDYLDSKYKRDKQTAC